VTPAELAAIVIQQRAPMSDLTLGDLLKYYEWEYACPGDAQRWLEAIAAAVTHR
jgi:hypothetical protein